MSLTRFRKRLISVMSTHAFPRTVVVVLVGLTSTLASRGDVQKVPSPPSPSSTCGTAKQDYALGGQANLPESYACTSHNMSQCTVDACCAACDALQPKCVAWTLNMGMNPPHCWLKPDMPNHPLPSHGATSGWAPGHGPPAPAPPTPPPPPCKGRCPNILYLMSDDMRPQLKTYGHEWMITPNLDGLAASGLQFDFAYTQFAYCAPSRNSFLSGRRPERTRALNFLSTFRQSPNGSSWTTMPEFFKVHGYFTSSAGKIFHDGMDDPQSWTYPSNQTKWLGCSEGDITPTPPIMTNFCGVTNASKVPYTDEDLALFEGLLRMDLAQASGKPWWVSIGVHRPHTNYRVPAGFYGPELYPNTTVLPPVHAGPPENAPYMSGNWQGGDISDAAHGCPTCIIPPNRSVEYRRWYYAAVTWADHSLGRALSRLESYGADVVNNTIVVFHSDHGYQLGELNEWSKKTDTELAVHVPLIVRVPWKTQSIGQRTTVKAEIVDMYRTLAALTELDTVAPLVQDSVQGMSLEAAFDNPTSLPPNLESKRAYSQIGRCACGAYCPGGKPNSIAGPYLPCPNTSSSFPRLNGPSRVTECGANACCKVILSDFDYMGYTVRTANRRFTAWVPMNSTSLRANWNGTVATELYDLTNDTGRDFDFDGYSFNLATDASYAGEVATLLSQLHEEVDTWY
eukprot:m.98441 g.98441  ORF g.98441 m.98441 type:complete len:681 (-) comp10258_c0_seq1:18-2060(-)